jgi:1,4-dihydroxy-2-naphthoyl-CoA hydrolase
LKPSSKKKLLYDKNMLFRSKPDLDFLNKMGQNTMVEHLGIKFTVVGDDYLEATMPVTDKTKQPLGLLHGGANVVLAETLGSVAGMLVIDPTEQFCVGLEINANHLKSVRDGVVTGIVKPIHIGKNTQVWEIKIHTSEKKLSCISRLTLAVLEKK